MRLSSIHDMKGACHLRPQETDQLQKLKLHLRNAKVV